MSEIDILIDQIRCELRENPFFTEGDLAALDDCLPTSDQIETAQKEEITQLVTEDPCAKKTIDAVNAELAKNDAKLFDFSNLTMLFKRPIKKKQLQ